MDIHSGKELYRTVSDYFVQTLGAKAQKIPLSLTQRCPLTPGCIYCNNAAFSPGYHLEGGKDIRAQIERGLEFFRGHESPIKLAYFQSFTPTFAPLQEVIGAFEQALGHPAIGGIVVATRPDCLSGALLDYFASRFGSAAPEPHPYLLVELGIESTLDSTLKRINRGHDFACSKKAALELAARGIDVGAHLILGLPGEDEKDFLSHADALSGLPIKTLKLHQLQIIKGTALAGEWERDPGSVKLFSAAEYARLVASFILRLRPDIALDRFVSEAPPSLLLAPRWGLKADQVREMINNEIRFQKIG